MQGRRSGWSWSDVTCHARRNFGEKKIKVKGTFAAKDIDNTHRNHNLEYNW